MHSTYHSACANWRPQIARYAASRGMRDWLTNRASLTARLTACSDDFRVERLQQHIAPCLADEAGVLGLHGRIQVVERDVLLRCDGVAVVYAHTVLPLSANASHWPLFAALGNRSLGTTLFNDPLVTRGPLYFARLKASHPLLRRIATLKLPGDHVSSLLARRSMFTRHGSSLLVTEVFLPSTDALTVKRPKAAG
jgi:chorismate--pyruvate lyase